MYGKRPEMWSCGDLFLHHNNAPAHRALFCSNCGQKLYGCFPHPPHSPDLVPCDFFLFPRMKGQIIVKRFAEVSEVKR